MKLKELVQIRGDYTEAVDIKLVFADADRNAAFIKRFLPSDDSVEALLTVARGIDVNSKEQRAHLITGSYGLGKSLVGLIIANYFARPQLPELQDLLRTIEQDWPQKAQELRRLRSAVSGNYLPILIQGNEADTVNEGLLGGLKRALVENGLPNIVPKTAYEIAVERLHEWRDKYSEIYAAFEKELEDERHSPSWLENELKGCKENAFRIFEKVHKVACGVPFEPYKTEREARQFYAQVINELRSRNTGFSGIAVIWDEYGERLREVGLGPNQSPDYLEEQMFAQYCKERGDDQVHYISIAHLTLKNYFKTDLDYENYRKSSGRLKESRITIQRAEEVIHQAIVQLYQENQEGWRKLRKQGNWQDAMKVTKSLDLFPERSDDWIRDVIVEGCFPLHPISVYCLPRLSERVGQFTRTSLTFLNDLQTGLKGFIEDEVNEAFVEPGRLNLYPVDRLLDYFEHQIEQSDLYRQAYRGYSAARQFAGDYEVLKTRILKVIAILEVIQDSKLRPTEDTIFASLYLPAAAHSDFVNALDELEKKGAIKRRASGEYRFLRGGDYNYQEDFRVAQKEVLSQLVNPIQTLCSKAGLGYLFASDYNYRYSMDRRLDRRFVEASALQNIRTFEEETETYPCQDGLILYIVCRSNKEITSAKKLACQVSHKQILIAIPKTATDVVDKFIDKIAARKVVDDLLGKGLPYESDEVEEARDQLTHYYNLLTEAKQTFIEPSQLDWYWQGEVVNVPDDEGLQKLATAVMDSVFPDTPIITQDRIAYKWQNFRKTDRRSALTKLLDPYSPVKLRRSTTRRDAVDTILRAALLDIGLLQFVQPAGDYDDYQVKVPDPSAPANKSWQEVDRIFSTASPDSILSDAIRVLRLPPFGMSTNAIEMFLGAYMRYNWAQLIVTDTQRKMVLHWDGDMIGSIVEYPLAYHVLYHKLQSGGTRYLDTMYQLLTGTRPPATGVSIGDIANRLIEWREGLAIDQTRAEKSSDTAKALLDAVEKTLTGEANIQKGLFDLVPESLGLGREIEHWDKSKLEEFARSFGQAKGELEGIPPSPIPPGLEPVAEFRQSLMDVLTKFSKKVSRKEIAQVLKELLTGYPDD